MNRAKELDQFYTDPVVAGKCIEKLLELLTIPDDFVWIEPSAGMGSFSNKFKQLKKEFIALDLDPKIDYARQIDFFEFVPPKTKKMVTIGNPPFGKKSKLAINFINKSFSDGSQIVAFILPLQFRKWSVQKQINKNAILIFDEILPKNSFIFNGKPYDVRCCFQIWALNDCDLLKTKNFVNLRIKEAPKTTHEDFIMYQYNRTIAAEKYFDYDWDFCVVRQGFYDYSIKYFDKSECDKKKQFIFFKAINKQVLNRLLEIDFEKLSLKNTSTPGFGKADVVTEYERIWGEEK